MKPENKKLLKELLIAFVGVCVVLLVGYIILMYQREQVEELCFNITNCTIMGLN
jgi:hypothetical protein